MSADGVACLVLAGGRGSRLGASVPKPLADLGGRPMIARVIERVPPTLAPVILNANDAEAFAPFGLPVVRDRIAGFQGPLAGLDAGCAWLRGTAPAVTHVLALPGDSPFVPTAFLERLAAEPDALPRIAIFRGRLQPTVALWPLTILDTLRSYLAASANRSMRGFIEQSDLQTLECEASPEAPDADPFFNVNTVAELERARAAFES